jgi:hypothetical protein
MSVNTESVEIQETTVALELNTVLAALKQLGCADLFKVMRTATTEAEKRSKEESKAPKKAKGPTPPQLQKPKAWVQYVLKYATENGWETFICENKKSGEEIVMPASELKEGKHVFPSGKALILTQAMSLSKKMWQAKAKTGTHEAVYREFETEFAARPVEVTVTAEAAPKAPLVRKTAEEKAAELAKKQEAAKAAKAAAAEEKKKAKAAKEAEKAPKAVPKAAVKAVKAAPAAPAAPVAVAAPAGVKPGPKKKAAEPAWSCPDDGNVYPWTYKGEKLLRNYENQIWSAESDGGCGDWKGLYLPAEDRIDDSAADPFADEEDED